MTVPVVELQGIYVVHVDLLNSVLDLLYLRLELSGHLSKTVELTSMPNKYKRTNMYAFPYLTISFYFIIILLYFKNGD